MEELGLAGNIQSIGPGDEPLDLRDLYSISISLDTRCLTEGNVEAYH